MAIAASAFIVSFLYIFVKAQQQKRVQYSEYIWMVPTSIAMAACEVFIMSTAVLAKEWWIFLPIGLGGGIGCMFSVWLHEKFRKNK